MQETTPTKVRKTPGTMKTMIGQWKETVDGPDTFVVLANVEPGEANIKAALRELGPGDYTAITGRERALKYGKKETDQFNLG